MRANDRRRLRWACAAVTGAALLLALPATAGRGTTPLSFRGPIDLSGSLNADTDDPGSVAIGDVNQDGRGDLVVGSAEDPALEVALNRGHATFGEARVYALGAQPVHIVIGDVNGDRREDLIAPDLGNTVSVLLNRGSAFDNHIEYALGPRRELDDVNVALGDVNGDGQPDLVSANSALNEVSVVLNDGKGAFGEPVTYPLAAPGYDLALGDLNGDGKLDIVVPDGKYQVAVLTNRGDGTYRARRNYRTGKLPYNVVTGDFNGDGKPDVVTSNCCGFSVLLNKGDGTLAPTRERQYGDNVNAAVDMNGDGRLDVVTDAGVLVNLGGARFAGLSFAPAGESVAGYLNGDRRPDLATITLDERNGSYGLSGVLNDRRFCSVQPIRGRTLAAASTRLRLANCRLGRVTRAYSSMRAGAVVAQHPGFGAVLSRGKAVDVVVSLGRRG